MMKAESVYIGGRIFNRLVFGNRINQVIQTGP